MDNNKTQQLGSTLPKDEEQNICKVNNPNDDEDVLQNTSEHKAANSENSRQESIPPENSTAKNDDTLGIP